MADVNTIRSAAGTRAAEIDPDRPQQPVLGLRPLLARIHNKECACSIGDFRLARRKTALPDQSRLLVTNC